MPVTVRPAIAAGREGLELLVEADRLQLDGGAAVSGQVHALLHRAAGRVFGLDGQPASLKPLITGADRPPLIGGADVPYRGSASGPDRSERLLPLGDTRLSFEMVPEETAILYLRAPQTKDLSLHVRDGDKIACARDGAIARQLVCIWIPKSAMQEITITSRAHTPCRVQILTN